MPKLIFLNTNDQINNLNSKGFNIKNSDIDSIKILSNISYFKLKPYVQIELKKNNNPCFKNVLDFMLIDNSIRPMIMQLIELVEIIVKSKLINFLCSNKLDVINCMKIPDKSKHQVQLEQKKYDQGNLNKKELQKLQTLSDRNHIAINDFYIDKDKIEKELQGLKEKIEKEHRKYKEVKNEYKSSYFSISEIKEIDKYINDGYSYNDLPSWVYIEKLTFGPITIIYKYLDDGNTNNLKQIFENIDFSHNDMPNALNGIRYLRNICSHNGRLMDKELRYSLPAYPKKYKKQFKNINEFFFLRYLLAIKVFIESFDKNIWDEFTMNLVTLINPELLHLYELPDNLFDILAY